MFHKRKRMRLIGWDYSDEGTYFLTLCSKNRKPMFSEIVGHGILDVPEVRLTHYGRLIQESILFLDEHKPQFVFHNWVIMPNHVHILVSLYPQASAGSGTSRMPCPTGAEEGTSGMPCPTGAEKGTSRMPCPTGAEEGTSGMPCPTGAEEGTSRMPCPTGAEEGTSGMPCPTGAEEGTSRMPCPTGAKEGTSGMPCPTGAEIAKLVSSLKRFTNRKGNGDLWQNSYYDHIIRDEQDFLRRWQYIENNPANWLDDDYFINDSLEVVK